MLLSKFPRRSRIKCSLYVASVRLKNIVFTAIDRSLPLTDQGPFDVLLHKVSGVSYDSIM